MDFASKKRKILNILACDCDAEKLQGHELLKFYVHTNCFEFISVRAVSVRKIWYRGIHVCRGNR